VSTSLYRYYERELVFIRQMAREFAKQFPSAAERLLLEENRSLDPHVERLLEGFALLAGRVQHKIDDEFPELTDALLNILYPHYLAPIPSTSVVQFDLDPERAQLPHGFVIDRHARLRTSPASGVRCRFRTGCPTTLWPVAIAEARLLVPPFPAGWEPPPRTKAALRLQIDTASEMPFPALSLDRLRLHLVGELPIVFTLYELLFNHAVQVVFRPLDKGTKATPLALRPEEALFPVGFDDSEAILPFPPHSFAGYRLLTEFFGTHVKFYFADLGGFRRVAAAGFQRKLEAIIYLDRKMERLEQAIDASTFRLHCATVINLFEQTAEPIPLTHTRSEYRIVPDVAYPHGLEVYSVQSVTGVDATGGPTIAYQPFYSFKHAGDRQKTRHFWYSRRREATGENDRGTDVYLSLVDLDFNPNVPDEKSLVVRTLCTNRDLPAQLRQATEWIIFELEQAAPIHKVVCLRAPTIPMRPTHRRGGYWRLISHLTLNHLSLGQGAEGRAALQELLRLYDFSDPELNQQQSAIVQQMIDGITSVTSRPVVGRIGGAGAAGFCRGTEVTIEFDETKYVGNPLFLFATVLERFLGLYVSINSFTQLVATTAQGQAVIKKWPPRAGEQPLV
jgi:type VI secretion system protein ImpG